VGLTSGTIRLARRFYNNSPPTILDIPLNSTWDSVGLPDPETPIGARGIGEPPVASAATAVLNAISDALGDQVFVRAPVMVDHIVKALDTKKPGQFPLTANV
jgi:CO/xanthine dehydrogenase Mo-binding subunit